MFTYELMIDKFKLDTKIHVCPVSEKKNRTLIKFSRT